MKFFEKLKSFSKKSLSKKEVVNINLYDDQLEKAKSIQKASSKTVGPYRDQVVIRRDAYAELVSDYWTGSTPKGSDQLKVHSNIMSIIGNLPLIFNCAVNLSTRILSIDTAGTGVDINFKITKKKLDRKINYNGISSEEIDKERIEKEFIASLLDDAYNLAVQEIAILSGKKTNAYSILSHTITISALESYSFIIFRPFHKNDNEKISVEIKCFHKTKDDLSDCYIKSIENLSFSDKETEDMFIFEKDTLSFSNGFFRCNFTGEIKYFSFKDEFLKPFIISEKYVILWGFRSKTNKDLFVPFYHEQLNNIQNIVALTYNLSNKSRIDASLNAIVSPHPSDSPLTSAGASIGARDLAESLKAASEAMKKEANNMNIVFSTVPLNITQLNANASSEGLAFLKFLEANVAVALYSTYTEISGDSANDNFSSAQAQQHILTARIQALQMMFAGDIRKFVNIILKKIVLPKLEENSDFFRLISSSEAKYEIDFDLLFNKIKSLDPLKDMEALVRLNTAGVMSKQTLMTRVDLDPNEELVRIEIEQKKQQEMMAEQSDLNTIKRPYVKSGEFVGKNL